MEKTTVFISWSGERSRAVAKALDTWLPNMVPYCEPWMSKNIDKGKLWMSKIVEALDRSSFGIICVTPENAEERWLHFEAGALSKKFPATDAEGDPYVCPYLFGFKKKGDVGLPFSSFQMTTASESDTLELVRTLNRAQGTDLQLKDKQLEHFFKSAWPEFKKDLDAVPKLKTPEPPPRDEGQVLDEVLTHVRGMSRRLDDLVRLGMLQKRASRLLESPLQLGMPWTDRVRTSSLLQALEEGSVSPSDARQRLLEIVASAEARQQVLRKKPKKRKKPKVGFPSPTGDDEEDA